MSDDLRAVRDFMNGRVATVPSPRLRNRVLAGPRPRRRWYLWAVPLTAAAVALATIAAVGLLARHDEPPPAGFTRGPELDVAAVFAELEAAAPKTRVPRLPAGGYLYSRRETVDEPGPRVFEYWEELNGLVPVKQRVDGQDVDSRPSIAEIARSARERLAQEGPDLLHPTPAWLAALPTDPDRLVAVLRAGVPESDPTASRCAAVFSLADPLLPGPLRLALLKILAATPGVRASEVTIGGKRQYAVRYAGVSGPTELFFDPATAHAVGYAALLSQSDPGPSAGPQPDSVRLWTFKVVSKLP
ncbi:hypothetical protein [Dactylosporangium sp. CA-092794]|uniref:hypothetical protein n=1 Tax=Dactylosporangium sp. CA-092794 TaxID=3239929 RepID=UPI003D8E4CB2